MEQLFLSEVESPVFALHERDDKHPISWDAFLLQDTAIVTRAECLAILGERSERSSKKSTHLLPLEQLTSTNKK